jgi:uncharacterized membrane-anchored protein
MLNPELLSQETSMILFSPLTALLRVLFTILFNGKTLVIGLVALVILVILGIMALYAGILVFAWNALLAPSAGRCCSCSESGSWASLAAACSAAGR